MNSSKFRITLDLHSVQSQHSIPAMLGDTYITLLMSISDGGVPYTIADGCLAKLSIKRPSGSHLEEFCKVSNNAIIEYPFKQNENTCAEVGIHFCDVTLYSPEGEELGSPRFIMVVSEKVVRRDDIELSTDDYTAVDAMIKAEAGRQLEESKRAEAEEERAKAEEERVAAESERTERFEAIKVDADRAEAAAERVEGYEGKILRNELHIANLVKGYNDNSFITDSATAYIKTVPENAFPCAAIESVGDTVTRIVSTRGNFAVTGEVITKPKSELTVKNLGNGEFQLNGYTSYQSEDLDENGQYRQYTFLTVPLKKGEYKITVSGPISGEIEGGCLESIDFVVPGATNGKNDKWVLANDATADFKVYCATNGYGFIKAVYAINIVRESDDGFGTAFADVREVPLGDDPLIVVEPAGTLRFENEGNKAVPSRVTYKLKGE